MPENVSVPASSHDPLMFPVFTNTSWSPLWYPAWIFTVAPVRLTPSTSEMVNVEVIAVAAAEGAYGTAAVSMLASSGASLTAVTLMLIVAETVPASASLIVKSNVLRTDPLRFVAGV